MGVNISKKRAEDLDVNLIFIHPENQRINKNHLRYETVLKATSLGGRFWKCIHKETKQAILLEEIPKISILNECKLKQLLNEFSILRVVNHPLIANLRYTFHDPYCIYMGFDYLGGGTLSYHLKRRVVLSEFEAKFNTACILSALEYLHKRNIVHGNISPDNLIFDLDGFIYLCDFKMATSLTNQQDEIDLIYEDFQNDTDLSYSAPEFLLRKNIGKAIDYYSMGMVVYEMMIGQNPLKGKGRKELVTVLNDGAIQVKKSELPEDWSFDAADFINRLIQRRPENRLGYYGFSQIKSHPWLKDFPWQKISTKTLDPPFKLKNDFRRNKKIIGDCKYGNVNAATSVSKLISDQEKKLVEHSQSVFCKFDFDFYKDNAGKEEGFLLENSSM